MTDKTPVLLLDDLVFPEGPRWHEGRLWFSDQHGLEVVAVDTSGKRETIVHVPQHPSGLGWLPDGRLLVVSMNDRKLLRLDGAELTAIADLSAHATFHCNDMVVDRRGRAYIGNFGFDLFGGGAPCPTALVLVEPNGLVRPVADNLMFPNGMLITPDERTLILSESFSRCLTAFDIADDGSLSKRRIWAQLDVPPDGICLDAEGCVWVAVPLLPGSLMRVAEGGHVHSRIEVSDHGVYACMLGGEQGRTLFLLESREGSPDRISRGNGRIRMLEVEVPHAGLP